MTKYINSVSIGIVHPFFLQIQQVVVIGLRYVSNFRNRVLQGFVKGWLGNKGFFAFEMVLLCVQVQ